MGMLLYNIYEKHNNKGIEMKIIVEVPKSLLNKVRNLVENERYSSLSEFFLVSAENQLVIEDSESDTFPFEERNSRPHGFSVNDYVFPSKEFDLLDQYAVEAEGRIWEHWLWGQINRILPIKFALRWLAIETARVESFPSLDEFSKNASTEARTFGKLLEKVDEKAGKKRDEKLSTGFPVGKDAESSKDRYWSQFIGYQKSDGSKTGACFDLGFADIYISNGDEKHIGLTREGKKFANLTNPVIDRKSFENSLSGKEIDFYLEHINSYCPGEEHLFSQILELLNSGKKQRDQINSELAKVVKSSGWSDGMISTQRSGAISRMYELGLIEKRRVGLEVRYELTSLGRKFLSDLEVS